MWAKIITIKRTKDLNYSSLCALNLFNTQVSQFELKYWNKLTFPRHSNLLRCTWKCNNNIFFTVAVDPNGWRCARWCDGLSSLWSQPLHRQTACMLRVNLLLCNAHTHTLAIQLKWPTVLLRIRQLVSSYCIMLMSSWRCVSTLKRVEECLFYVGCLL